MQGIKFKAESKHTIVQKKIQNQNVLRKYGFVTGSMN